MRDGNSDSFPPTVLNGDIMRLSNSTPPAIALAACFGIACPATQAAGVDAKSVVDAKVRCAFPTVLARAIRGHARQETRERKEEFETMKEQTAPKAPATYRWCAVDLNGDGKLEVIYRTGFCGMGGCISDVLAWRAAKLTRIGMIGVSHDGPMIGKRRHRGWRDLYIWQKGSATSFSVPVYTFRRGAYRSVGIPLLFSEWSDRFINPDGITINRERNDFRIGENVPKEERDKRLQGHRGWDASHWEGSDPGYRDEAYQTEN